MADNVSITAGSGTAVRTDDVGGVQYQVVKLDVGGDGLTVPVVGSVPASGDVASGAADGGNPVKIGGRAGSSAGPPVAAGQRVDAWSDLFGRQVVSDLDPEWGLASGLTVLRDRMVAQRYTVLSDSIADGLATFWTTTTSNGGTVTIATGEGLVQSNANAVGTAQIVSTAPPYHPGQQAWLNSAVRFGDTGSAGNVRRIGAFTVNGAGVPQDGFYYELNGTTFNAVSAKAGTATAVAAASWSRVVAAPFTLDTAYHQFEIRWTANRCDFLIDNVLRHTASGGSTSITGTLNFPMALQSLNSSGATDRVIAVRNIGLGRFGAPEEASHSPNTTLQSAAAAVGNGTAMNTTAYGTAALQVTGTFVGTITFEGTIDGTNYVAIAATGESATSVSTTATAPGIYRLSVAGLNNMRARVSAFTSGAITVVGRTLNAPYAPKFVQLAAGAASVGTVAAPAITRGTQGTTGFAVQQLKDGGRNLTTFFMALPIAGTATDALMSLTSYKSGAAVAATTTPAVVTTGKTLRITTVSISFTSIGSGTGARIYLRANTSGVVAVTSPIVTNWMIHSADVVANVGIAYPVQIPDGLEFAAGTGIGISLQGMVAPGTAGASGFAHVSLIGFEY